MQFPKCCVFSYLEFRMMDKVQNLNNSKYENVVWTAVRNISPQYVFNVVFKFSIRNLTTRRTFEDFPDRFIVDVIATYVISPSQK
jgi:hypothetical protein